MHAYDVYQYRMRSQHRDGLLELLQNMIGVCHPDNY
jgi:hypothetical protein